MRIERARADIWRVDHFAFANFLASSSFGNVSAALALARFRRGSSNETYHLAWDLLAMRPSRGLRRRLGDVGDEPELVGILHPCVTIATPERPYFFGANQASVTVLSMMCR